MPSDKKPSSPAEFLDGLVAFLSATSNDELLDVLKSELRDEGIDVDRLVKRVSTIANRHIAVHRLDWAHRERESLLVRLHSLKDQFAAGVLKRVDVLTRLQQEPSLATYYREFEKATDDDLSSMLEDLDMLRAWDKDRVK
jgi:hypothetical protein